jgi:hypothetical protein
MRSMAIVVALAGTASAGPVVRIGVIGGYDATAPGHRDDGLVAAAGYAMGPLTAELQYAYLDYDGSDGVEGSSQRAGLLLQARLATLKSREHEPSSHVDLDVGVGERWVHWEPGHDMPYPVVAPPIDRHGREVSLGVSATFGWRWALEYVLFRPDAGPMFTCRGTCPMQQQGDASAVLLEVGWVFGG